MYLHIYNILYNNDMDFNKSAINKLQQDAVESRISITAVCVALIKGHYSGQYEEVMQTYNIPESNTDWTAQHVQVFLDATETSGSLPPDIVQALRTILHQIDGEQMLNVTAGEWARYVHTLSCSDEMKANLVEAFAAEVQELVMDFLSSDQDEKFSAEEAEAAERVEQQIMLFVQQHISSLLASEQN